MGLDQFAFKVRRLTNEEIESIKGCEFNSLPQGIVAFSPDVPNECIRDLKPYLKKVVLKVSYNNLEKLLADSNLPNDPYITGQSFSEDTVSFFCSYNEDGEQKMEKLSFPRSEYFEKYVYEKDEECYACHEERIGYWRKDYDLSYQIQSILDVDTGNCKYNYVDDTEALNAMGLSDMEIDEEEAVFYYEWF